MRCGDCIHFPVCDTSYETIDNMELKCPDFKNKVDFVEVVRCKDCLYYEPNPYNKEEMVCRCYADWSFPEPNDFCSHGERRTG